MAVVSLFIQVVGIFIGIYIAFTESLFSGVLLIGLVGVLHFLFTALSNGLTGLHEKLMSEKDLDDLAHMSRATQSYDFVPFAWKIIVNTCTISFWITAAYLMYWFLVD